MEKFVAQLRNQFPALKFVQSEVASWSPRQQQVSYVVTKEEGQDMWSLLHELGHALLGHESYQTDANLLQKEAEAWERALELAGIYQITINPEHIENCLDTYRDWLHRRSTCPDCSSHGLQLNKSLYSCLNCQTRWQVSNARFCRPYRLKKALAA